MKKKRANERLYKAKLIEYNHSKHYNDIRKKNRIDVWFVIMKYIF